MRKRNSRRRRRLELAVNRKNDDVETCNLFEISGLIISISLSLLIVLIHLVELMKFRDIDVLVTNETSAPVCSSKQSLETYGKFNEEIVLGKSCRCLDDSMFNSISSLYISIMLLVTTTIGSRQIKKVSFSATAHRGLFN